METASKCKRTRRSLSNNIQQENTRKVSARIQSRNASDSKVCPVCTVTIRGKKEFELHYQKEVDQLNQSPSIKPSKRKYKIKLTNENEDEHSPKKEIPLEERENIFKDIRKRKYNRYADMFLLSMSQTKNLTNSHETNSLNFHENNSSQQHTNNTTESNSHNNSNETNSNDINAGYELMQCAVCNEFLETSNREISAKHLSKCFAKKSYELDLFSSSDEEEDTVEEFSWAGQTRVRASSMLDSEYFQQEGRMTRLQMEDGDEELDVDGDQGETFGHQQFSEADIIPCTSDNSNTKSQQKLREAVCHGSSSSSSTVSSVSNQWNNELEILEERNLDKILESCNGNREQFIECLKSRIFKLEDKLDIDVAKCSICMGPYKNPVVSTNCWHVCCSECWMRTLGAKKLCPKCNNIVAPTQLRKVYL